MLRGLEPDIFSGIIEGALKVLDIPKGGGGYKLFKVLVQEGPGVHFQPGLSPSRAVLYF
jgi:hypothetical protein